MQVAAKGTPNMSHTLPRSPRPQADWQK